MNEDYNPGGGDNQNGGDNQIEGYREPEGSFNSNGLYNDPSFKEGSAQNQDLPARKPKEENSNTPSENALNGTSVNNNSATAGNSNSPQGATPGQNSPNSPQKGLKGKYDQLKNSGRNKAQGAVNEVKNTAKDVAALVATGGTSVKAWASLISKHWKVFAALFLIQIIVFVGVIILLFSLFSGGGATAQNPAGAYAMGSLTSQDVPDEFNPSYLMGDDFFQAKDMLTEDQIRAFMKSYDSALLKVNPSIFGNNPETGQPETRDAAKIVYDASRSVYKPKSKPNTKITVSINPIILLVKLQKENSLLEEKDTLNNFEHRLGKATGFGCPDGVPCNPKYAGFSMQVYSAAGRMYETFLNGQKSGKVGAYKIGGTYGISATNAKTPYQNVRIGNVATAVFYYYTPHIRDGNFNLWSITRKYCKKLGIQDMGNEVVVVPEGTNAIKSPQQVPRITQTSWVNPNVHDSRCNIAAYLMVAKYYGLDVDKYVQADSTHSGTYVLKDNIKIPTLEAMAQVKGVTLTAYSGSVVKSKPSDMIVRIRKSIDAGDPVVISNFQMGSSRNHFRVIVGYNNKGWIYNDPYPGPASYTEEVAYSSKYGASSYKRFIATVNKVIIRTK